MAKPYAVVGEDEKGFVVEQAGALSVLSYEYDKLPSGSHLRLLELLPGDGGRLECDIATYPLDGPDTPPYRALSYCWQNPKFDDLVIGGNRIPHDDALRSQYLACHPLWCGERRLLISTSLRDALRRLRSESEPTMLWVDALCINQDDLDERASQVLLMQRIYHAADEVCMWLGTEDDSSRSAFQLLGKLADANDQRRSGLITGQTLYNPQSMERLGLPAFPSEDWERLMTLVARPYFRRIWIVQEMIAAPLGSNLYCGALDPIPWTTLTTAAGFLSHTGWQPAIDSYYGGQNNFSFILITVSIAMAWLQGAATPADRLLIRRKAQSTRRFEATDPRDKVFALIGIINDFGHRDLHGEDAPEGHGTPQTVTRDGVVHATFKVDERGKSAEDIAIEILRSNPDEAIRDLYEALRDFLAGGLFLAEGVLDPANPVFEEDRVPMLNNLINSIHFIGDFREEYSGTSLDHKRVGTFAWNLFNMFSSGITLYMKANELRETRPDGFARVCSDPEIRDGALRFKEGLEHILDSLEQNVKDDEAESSLARLSERQPIFMGDRQSLEGLVYSVKIERQYPDWAWSAAGWTMPMYDRPVEQIYTEYVVKCIQDDGNLDILSDVEDHSLRKLPGLPSWVPDFSVPLTLSPLASWQRTKNEGLYSAGGSSTAEPKWTAQGGGKEIVLSGCQIDEILALASLESAKENEIENQPQEWAALIEPLPADYPSGCPKTEALWRTLIGDSGAEDEYPAPAEYGTHYETLQTLIKINRELDARIEAGETGGPALRELCLANGFPPTQMPRLMADKDEFQRAMADVMLGRRLFVTKRGYIGAGPLSAQVGDAVYVLAGGHVPLVLRKGSQQGDGDPSDGPLTLVGDCYVHGVMQGESVAWPDFSWKEVRLC
jgi:hypothetical protein